MGSVISADARSVIEYWESGGDYGTPKDLKFRFKMDTDLYNLAKAPVSPHLTRRRTIASPTARLHATTPFRQAKALPTSLSVSPNGEFFAVTSTDSKVRVYRYLTGKTRRTYDESYDALNQLQKEGDDAYRLEAFDFGRCGLCSCTPLSRRCVGRSLCLLAVGGWRWSGSTAQLAPLRRRPTCALTAPPA